MPPSFIGETIGELPDFWAPLTMEEHFLPGRHWLSRRTARLSRYLQSLLFGLTPADGWSIFAVVVIIGFMAVSASVIPARRATRIDPVTALRCE